MSRRLAWMDKAACRGVEGFTELPPDEAKAYCKSPCPVSLECSLWLREFNLLSDLVMEGYPIVYGGQTPYEATGPAMACTHRRGEDCYVCVWRQRLVGTAASWEGDLVGLAEHLGKPISTVRQALKRWAPVLHYRIMTRTQDMRDSTSVAG